MRNFHTLARAVCGLAIAVAAAWTPVALGGDSGRGDAGANKTYKLQGAFPGDSASKVTMNVIVHNGKPVKATHVSFKVTYYCNDGEVLTGSGVESSTLPGSFKFKKEGKRYHASRPKVNVGDDTWGSGFYTKDGKQVEGTASLTKDNPDSPPHPCANQQNGFSADK